MASDDAKGQRGQEQSQSPPPPSRPISLSPGIRASLLQKVYNDALSHTLRICSYTNFASCFPTPARHVPEALDGLHRDFIGRLDDICKVRSYPNFLNPFIGSESTRTNQRLALQAEFSELLEDRDVVPGLNELDTLIADAKRRKERAEGAVGEVDCGDAPQVAPPTPYGNPSLWQPVARKHRLIVIDPTSSPRQRCSQHTWHRSSPRRQTR